MTTLLEGLLVDHHDDFGFARSGCRTGEEVDERMGTEPIHRIERVGGALGRTDLLEANLELVVEALQEHCSELGVELTRNIDHAGVQVGAPAQPGVALLPFEALLAVVGFDEPDLALHPGAELFDCGAFGDGPGNELRLERPQHRLEARFERADRRGEGVEMLGREPTLIHLGFHLGCLRRLIGTEHCTTSRRGRAAGGLRVDCLGVDTRSLRGEPAEPLVQVDLTGLQETMEPGDIGQEPGNGTIIEGTDVGGGEPLEPVDQCGGRVADAIGTGRIICVHTHPPQRTHHRWVTSIRPSLREPGGRVRSGPEGKIGTQPSIGERVFDVNTRARNFLAWFRPTQAR